MYCLNQTSNTFLSRHGQNSAAVFSEISDMQGGNVEISNGFHYIAEQFLDYCFIDTPFLMLAFEKGKPCANIDMQILTTRAFRQFLLHKVCSVSYEEVTDDEFIQWYQKLTVNQKKSLRLKEYHYGIALGFNGYWTVCKKKSNCYETITPLKNICVDSLYVSNNHGIVAVITEIKSGFGNIFINSNQECLIWWDAMSTEHLQAFKTDLNTKNLQPMAHCKRKIQRT